MSAKTVRSTALAAMALSACLLLANGTADATSGESLVSETDTALAQLSSRATSATAGTQDITITETADPGGDGTATGVALDGDYVISSGGTRTTAVLGAVTFNSTGAVVGGSISFIAAGMPPAAATSLSSRATARATATATADTIASAGGGGFAASAGTSAASVTNCTVTGGSYTLTDTGAGEARLQLDCAGAGARTATWKLFVTAGDGFSLAQQVRAVQLEALPGASENDIVDLTLTLR